MVAMVHLNEAQLRRLVKLIHKKEEYTIINEIDFGCENERAKFLRKCKANHHSAIEMLNAGDKLVKEFNDDPARGPIAHDIFKSIQESVNSAYQWVKNYTLRKSYLEKIKGFSDSAIDTVKKLDPKDTESAKVLAKAADDYKKAMSELNKKCMCPRSAAVATVFEGKRVTMDKLLDRAQKKLKLSEPFDKLSDENKLKVYEKVIKFSAEETLFSKVWANVFGAAGVALLLFAAGMMVWDIYTSDHPIRTATHDGVLAAASFAGAAVGDIIGTVAASTLVGTATFAAAAIVAVVGVAFSIAGAVILGEFAGCIIDFILSSGPTAPLSTDGLRCYIAPMPDGLALARQILHHDNDDR
ncbi:hypothetical protein CFOL_v3_17768 [Cephalotus follicularis]|uniref:Uncharacterized protein n=1 Tax=Cephalotus follicularis TaxID=3775 RepID=A0A1Q3C2E5_CEPFO|nr:hypothetical protein CFOL_v3_17768 [Cephalotus follicularis]